MDTDTSKWVILGAAAAVYFLALGALALKDVARSLAGINAALWAMKDAKQGRSLGGLADYMPSDRNLSTASRSSSSENAARAP